ncbi:hypothetical protein ACTTAI_08365 [Rhodobacter capsulatus]|uniref:hypothetical protein n=1 Tax=Rhodobacter capsulatus TaxID=1061 RepID=UPI004029557C
MRDETQPAPAAPPPGAGCCHVCGRALPATELQPFLSVRPGLSALIEAEAPGLGRGRPDLPH